MTGADYDALIQQLIVHEGLRLKPYDDGGGKITIGVGHNLTDRGITREQAMALLEDDIADTISGLTERWPWSSALPVAAERVLIDVAFNTGLSGLAKFVKFLAALEIGDYMTAANELVNSRIAPNRAQRLAAMLRAA